MGQLLLILIAIAICAARFLVPPTHVSVSGSYQAFAHLFVGGLLGAGFARRDSFYFVIAGAMSALEVFAAVWTRVAAACLLFLLTASPILAGDGSFSVVGSRHRDKGFCLVSAPSKCVCKDCTCTKAQCNDSACLQRTATNERPDLEVTVSPSTPAVSGYERVRVCDSGGCRYEWRPMKESAAIQASHATDPPSVSACQSCVSRPRFSFGRRMRR